MPPGAYLHTLLHWRPAAIVHIIFRLTKNPYLWGLNKNYYGNPHRTGRTGTVYK